MFLRAHCCEANCHRFAFGLAVLVVGHLTFGSSQEFGYDGEEGPEHWKDKYASCVGKHQSPINIDTMHVKDFEYPPLNFRNMHSTKAAQLVNNGHTVQMKLTGTEVPMVSGGPLGGDYNFLQLHFHWGDNDTFGSENLIDNRSFPLELHMVFFKSEYSSAGEAMKHSDGLTVLSFLYDIGGHDNPDYDDFIKALKEIHTPDTTADMPHSVSLYSLVGIALDSQDYFTYEGSLTTPPCSEIVQWIEFEPRIQLSHNQLEEFRHLYAHQGRMRHNFRPTQPLNDRQIIHNVQPRERRIDNEVERDMGHKSSSADQAFSAQQIGIWFTITALALAVTGEIVLL